MGLKIKKFFLLIILILLQGCSGGRIGNFLESSFNNLEEQKIKEETKNTLTNKIVAKSVENLEKTKYTQEQKIKQDTKNNLKNKMMIKTEKNPKNKKKIVKQNISSKKRKYQPQSYKIIFILKDVDPKDPIEDLSTILRNSDVNFEIEKIERFFDSKSTTINKN
tara:strand:+ start:71 stop:562 length:492 start_codon:yes stop_codon:yes gene_type:complete